MPGLAGAAGQRSKDEAAMWVDLLMGHTRAESAHLDVTRRAELYVRVAGLPLDRVLDALRTDEPGWAARLAALRVSEARNREAADRTCRRHEEEIEAAVRAGTEPAGAAS